MNTEQEISAGSLNRMRSLPSAFLPSASEILVSRLPGYAQLVPGASKLRTETRKTQTEEGNSKAIEDTTQQEC